MVPKSIDIIMCLWQDWSVSQIHRVVLYARVSTRDKGQDVRNQLAQLREFCARQSWKIIHEYMDQASGKSAEQWPGGPSARRTTLLAQSGHLLAQSGHRAGQAGIRAAVTTSANSSPWPKAQPRPRRYTRIYAGRPLRAGFHERSEV